MRKALPVATFTEPFPRVRVRLEGPTSTTYDWRIANRSSMRAMTDWTDLNQISQARRSRKNNAQDNCDISVRGIIAPTSSRLVEFGSARVPNCRVAFGEGREGLAHLSR
jgi:hypothetical protein